MDILPIAELSYHIAGSGQPARKFRLDTNGKSPQIIANEHLQKAIEQHGIWDETETVFYPWHTILRVEATGSEFNEEEATRRAQKSSLLGSQ